MTSTPVTFASSTELVALSHDLICSFWLVSAAGNFVRHRHDVVHIAFVAATFCEMTQDHGGATRCPDNFVTTVESA